MASLARWPAEGVPDNPGAWLTTVGRRRAIDIIRRNRRFPSRLSKEARVALSLRLLGGLTIQEIARAFLVPEPTIAQRIVRAKRTLSEAGVPF